MTDSQKLGLSFKTVQWNATANTPLTENEFLAKCQNEMLDGFAAERVSWRTQQGLAAFAAQTPDAQEAMLKQLGVPQNP